MAMKNKLVYKFSDKVKIQDGKITPPSVFHPTDSNEKPENQKQSNGKSNL